MRRVLIFNSAHGDRLAVLIDRKGETDNRPRRTPYYPGKASVDRLKNILPATPDQIYFYPSGLVMLLWVRE